MGIVWKSLRDGADRQRQAFLAAFIDSWVLLIRAFLTTKLLTVHLVTNTASTGIIPRKEQHIHSGGQYAI
jgi:hypothetical protein